MKHAIIDLGTNTFNLLIVENRSENNYSILFNDKVAVKLGKDCIDKNIISDEAIERALNALHTHLYSISKYKVDTIKAIATSAIRSAVNGESFVRKVKYELDIDIEVISGDKEAAYIYDGVCQAVELGEGRSLIMDIGGGSTEFIIANNRQIFWKHSFDLGISRLIEKFKPHDPILLHEIVEIENYLNHELQPLFKAAKEFPFSTLIGSSGSFDTLADMLLYKSILHGLDTKETTYNFDIDKYNQLHKELLLSTYEQRLAMKGMLPMRADMMVLGSIFIRFIIMRLNIFEMKLSTYALKEGVVWEVIRKG